MNRDYPISIGGKAVPFMERSRTTLKEGGAEEILLNLGGPWGLRGFHLRMRSLGVTAYAELGVGGGYEGGERTKRGDSGSSKKVTAEQRLGAPIVISNVGKTHPKPETRSLEGWVKRENRCRRHKRKITNRGGEALPQPR